MRERTGKRKTKIRGKVREVNKLATNCVDKANGDSELILAKLISKKHF